MGSQTALSTQRNRCSGSEFSQGSGRIRHPGPLH